MHEIVIIGRDFSDIGKVIFGGMEWRFIISGTIMQPFLTFLINMQEITRKQFQKCFPITNEKIISAKKIQKSLAAMANIFSYYSATMGGGKN